VLEKLDFYHVFIGLLDKVMWFHLGQQLKSHTYQCYCTARLQCIFIDNKFIKSAAA